jgi:hypothetical protein
MRQFTSLYQATGYSADDLDLIPGSLKDISGSIKDISFCQRIQTVFQVLPASKAMDSGAKPNLHAIQCGREGCVDL